MKSFAFWFHYNKPETQRRGKVTLSLHYKGQCHLIDNIECFVTVAGRIRKDQPRFVMAGRAHMVLEPSPGIARII